MHEADRRAQKGIVVGQGLGRTSQMAASEGQGEREKNEGPSRVEKGHCGYEQRGLGPMQPNRHHAGPGAPRTPAGRCVFYFTKCKITRVKMLCTLLWTQEGATKGLF